MSQENETTAAKPKKKLSLLAKIFIALGLGIVFGLILNAMGGTDVPVINDIILPILQFMGDLFIRLIRMIVVPLVFFSIMDAAFSLGDIKKLTSVGIKTIVWFLATGCVSATVGLVWVNIIKPGVGLQLATEGYEVTVGELPGISETLLDLIPLNPFEALSNGDMMPIIVFSLFVGFGIISIGDSVKPLANIITMLAQVMFKIIDVIIQIIPYGVFGLMSVTMTKYGAAVFGPVLKFIVTDYMTAITNTIVFYGLLLCLIGHVNPITFAKKVAQSWLVAFTTCTSSAALPISMDIAPKRLGAPKDISSFVLPLGCTAQMNGTCGYFGVVVLFAAQLYGVDLSIEQQILLVIQATFLSVGCAATPQIGLVLSLTLMTQMGLPLDAYAMVAGIYRIVDQIHTATNSVGDLVATVCISEMEGELDHEVFNNPAA